MCERIDKCMFFCYIALFLMQRSATLIKYNNTMNTRIFSTLLSTAALFVAFPAFAFSVGIPEVINGQSFGIPEGPIEGPEQVLPPTSVEQTASEEQSITVSWTSSYFSITPVQEEYQVVVMNNKNNEVVYNEQITGRTVTVDTLESNNPYTVSVLTVRGEYRSEPVLITARTAPVAPVVVDSEVQEKQLLRDVISNKPVNGFDESSGGKYIARITWNASEGKIRGYDVLVFHNGETEPFQTVSTTKTRATITGLKAGAVYQYQVVSRFNDNYVSQSSKRMQLKIKRVGVKRSKLVSSNSNKNKKAKKNSQPARLNLQ